jgi:hypothetical protein
LGGDAKAPAAREFDRGLFCKAEESIIARMTQKELVLKAIAVVPDDASLAKIAERVAFLGAVQKGLDQLDRGEGIPHEEVKRQLAAWLRN